MSKAHLAIFAMSAAYNPLAASSALAGTDSGFTYFAQQCGGCHSLKQGEVRVGPSLHRIHNRPAGQMKGFAYSVALKKSKLRWDAKTLDRWIADSSAAVPGTTMYFRQMDTKKRKAIVDFLKNNKY